MFKKIQIVTQLNPLQVNDLWVNNQLINNVSPPNSEGIIFFNSGHKSYLYKGTLSQFKNDLGL